MTNYHSIKKTHQVDTQFSPPDGFERTAVTFAGKADSNLVHLRRCDGIVYDALEAGALSVAGLRDLVKTCLFIGPGDVPTLVSTPMRVLSQQPLKNVGMTAKP